MQEDFSLVEMTCFDILRNRIPSVFHFFPHHPLEKEFFIFSGVVIVTVSAGNMLERVITTFRSVLCEGSGLVYG